MLQPRGVMVAQVILVHFVEVRILTGLPFFCLEKAKKVKTQVFSSRDVRRTSLKRRQAFLPCCGVICNADEDGTSLPNSG